MSLSFVNQKHRFHLSTDILFEASDLLKALAKGKRKRLNTEAQRKFTQEHIDGIISGTMMKIVIDTNVFVSALMSQRGASFKLLSLVGQGNFRICLSVPLVLEYEDASKRLLGDKIKLTEEALSDILDYLCSVGEHQKVFYLWRPLLKDPRDELVLELAANARADAIISYNERDFLGAERFGIKVIGSKAFLEMIGALP
jgi:putative PIN family toxin of toxin-antitoxin system